VQRIRSKDYVELEKTINRKLRKVGPNYGIRNLYRTPQGRYRFEMKVSVDPRDEAKLHQIIREVLRQLPGDRPVQAKWYLPESLVERVKSRAKKRGVSQSALVAEYLADAL
jgi:hypothetical protein